MKKNKCFIFIDLETTGLHFTNEVTEIVAKYQIEGTKHTENLYNSLTNITGDIPNNIIKINKINKDMLFFHQHYENAFQVLATKINLLKDKYDVVVVAHNAVFEKKFMSYNLPSKTMFKLKFVCTGANFLYTINKTVDKYQKGWSLQNTCHHYKIAYHSSKAHRAEYDVDTTMQVFHKQLKTIGIDKMLEIFSYMEN